MWFLVWLTCHHDIIVLDVYYDILESCRRFNFIVKIRAHLYLGNQNVSSYYLIFIQVLFPDLVLWRIFQTARVFGSESMGNSLNTSVII